MYLQVNVRDEGVGYTFPSSKNISQQVNESDLCQQDSQKTTEWLTQFWLYKEHNFSGK